MILGIGMEYWWRESFLEESVRGFTRNDNRIGYGKISWELPLNMTKLYSQPGNKLSPTIPSAKRRNWERWL